MNQKGGKILSRGSYGTVISPPVVCDGENLEGEQLERYVRDYVAKIMRNDHYVSEVEENERIRQIDPDNHFTLSPHPRGCMYDLNDQPDEIFEDIEQSGIPLNQDIYNAIIMRNGGIDLYDFLNIQRYRRTLSNRYNDFLLGLRRVFVGIHILRQRGYNHCDLKLENILINPETFEMNIIDFGFLSRVGDISSINRLRHFYFLLGPMQYFVNKDTITYSNKYLCNIYTDLHSTNQETNQRGLQKADQLGRILAQDFIDYRSNRQLLFSKEEDEFVNECRLYIRRVCDNNNLANVRQKIINHHTSKIDVFSMGFVIARILFMYPNLRSDPVYGNELKNIGSLFLNPDPERRRSQEDALRLYDELLGRLGVVIPEGLYRIPEAPADGAPPATPPAAGADGAPPATPPAAGPPVAAAGAGGAPPATPPAAGPPVAAAGAGGAPPATPPVVVEEPIIVGSAHNTLAAEQGVVSGLTENDHHSNQATHYSNQATHYSNQGDQDGLYIDDLYADGNPHGSHGGSRRKKKGRKTKKRKTKKSKNKMKRGRSLKNRRKNRKRRTKKN
jgi:serine/threonine protein kinase